MYVFFFVWIVLEVLDIIVFLKCRLEYMDLILRVLIYNKYYGFENELCKVEDILYFFRWFLGFVSEEKNKVFLNLLF